MTAIEQFCKEYHAYNGISPGRRHQQRQALREFEAHLGKPLVEATARDFASFLVDLIDDEGNAPSTVMKKRNMIRPFYGWAPGAELMDRAAADEVLTVRSPRAREISTEPRPYDRGELDAFYARLAAVLPFASKKALGWWTRGQSHYRRVWKHGMRLQIEAIVGLALYCGLRRHEIFSVSLDDIAVENEYVVVRCGKGGKARKVPYPPELKKIVGAWLAWRASLQPAHDGVWLSLRTHASDGPTTAMSKPCFGSVLHQVERGWTLHRFRHTCGTEWLRAGMPLEKVQRLLGHADIKMTLRYAKIVDSDVAKSMVNAEARFTRAVAPREAVAA